MPFRAGASNGPTAAAMSIGVAIPAAAQAGDVALAWISTGAQQGVDFVAPGGWNIVGTRVDTGTQSTALYLKVLAGGDLGSTPTWTYVTSAKATAFMVVSSGINTGSPIAQALVQPYSTGGTSRTAPATTGASAPLIEYATTRAGTTSSWTIPAGFTAAAAQAANGGAASVASQAAYSMTNLAGGDTWTQSPTSTNAAVWSVSLNPATGTPPPNTSTFFAFI